MNWTYPAGAGDAGIYEIGRRLAVHLGRMPDATSFTYDPRQMLRITRRVERAARGGRLLVGFQRAAKFDLEVERYHDLLSAGTVITVFAHGRPEVCPDGLDYREVPHDVRRLENQWFLISRSPEPVAFVSWELGDEQAFGVGGAAAEGKHFVGFVSDDPDVVAALAAALEAVQGLTPPPAATRPVPSPEVDELAARVRAVDPPTMDAHPGAVVVPVGRGNSDDAVRLALAIGLAESRAVVLVDRSSEGLFSSPYASMRADDSLRPRRDALFDAAIAGREGRAETATAIAAAGVLGVECGGWFPTAAGAEGLSIAARQFGGAVLVLPESVHRPGIGERIRGMSIQSLERLGLALVIAHRPY